MDTAMAGWGVKTHRAVRVTGRPGMEKLPPGTMDSPLSELIQAPPFSGVQ